MRVLVSYIYFNGNLSLPQDPVYPVGRTCLAGHWRYFGGVGRDAPQDQQMVSCNRALSKRLDWKHFFMRTPDRDEATPNDVAKRGQKPNKNGPAPSEKLMFDQ